MHANAKNAKNAMHGQKPHAFLGKNHTYAGHLLLLCRAAAVPCRPVSAVHARARACRCASTSPTACPHTMPRLTACPYTSALPTAYPYRSAWPTACPYTSGNNKGSNSSNKDSDSSSGNDDDDDDDDDDDE